jgi:hypothetical protein
MGRLNFVCSVGIHVLDSHRNLNVRSEQGVSQLGRAVILALLPAHDRSAPPVM